jgi:hypothetical protein
LPATSWYLMRRKSDKLLAQEGVACDGFGSHGPDSHGLAHGDLTKGLAAVCAFGGEEPGSSAGRPWAGWPLHQPLHDGMQDRLGAVGYTQL